MPPILSGLYVSPEADKEIEENEAEEPEYNNPVLM
jgi:hypothetical protein